MTNNASATFLLRFKGEFSELQAGIKSISALAKTEASKVAAGIPSTATPSQSVKTLATEKGKAVGDIRAAQQAGMLSKSEADKWVRSYGQEYNKQFRQVMQAAGVQKGTPAYAAAEKQYKTAVAAAQQEQIKAYKDHASATQNLTNVTNETAKGAKQSAQQRAKQQKAADKVLGSEPISPEEAAKEGAAARKVAARYGVAQQEAYLDQIQNDPQFAANLANEKFAREKRLAIERQQYNDRVLSDFNTSRPGESAIEKRAEATAGQKKITALEQAGVQERLAGDQQYLTATALAASAQKRIAASVTERLAADSSLQQALIRSASVEREASAVRKAAVEKYLASSPVYNRAVSEGKVSQYQQKIAQADEFVAAGGVQAAGVAKAKEAAIQSEINAVKYEELSVNQAAIKAKARSIVAEREYKAALDAEVAQLSASNPNISGPVRGRKFLSFLGGNARGGGGGGFAGGDETAGEFFGSGLRTTLRYALPSLLLFGAAGKITETVKQASELERIFNQIEAQFKAVDDAASFPKFKQSVLDISRETGVASDVLANIAFQYKGAFGEQGNDFVLQQTASAAKVAKVTGLDPAEVVDSLTAITLAFDTTNDHIGDVALDIQDRFGVMAKETIKFLGDIAPVAEDAGFSLEEIATLAGLAQQRSGRSGAALAESFGRVLPAMKEAKGELLALSAQSDAFKAPEFIRAVISGDVSKQFQYIAQNFSKLDAQGQGFVVNLLGGRREAQAILPVFADATDLDAQVQKTRDADPNLLENRFAALQETLTQGAARLGETFKQLGVDLFESGLGDFLKDMVEVARLFVSVFALVGKVLLTINKATGGMAGRLLAIYTVFKLMSALKGSSFVAGIGGTLASPGLGKSLGNLAFGSATGMGSAAPAAAAFNPVGLAVTAAAIGGTAYFAARSARQEEDQKFAQSLRDRTNEELAKAEEKFGYGTQSLKSNVGAFLTGSKTKAERLTDERQRRSADDYGIEQLKFLQKTPAYTDELFQKAVQSADITKKNKAKLSKTTLDEFTKKFILDPENDVYQEIFGSIQDSINGNGTVGSGVLNETDTKQFLSIYSSGSKKRSNAEEVDKILKVADQSYRSFEELQASYQAGEVNIGKLTDNVDKRIAAIQKALDISPNDEVALKEMAKYVKVRNDLWGEFLDQQMDIDLKVADYSGLITEDNQADFMIAALTKKLRNPDYNDPARRKEATQQLLQAYKSKLDQQLKSPELTQAKLNELSTTGIALPEDVQKDFVESQLGDDNIAFTELFNQWRGMAGGKKSEIQAMIGKAITGTDQEKALIIADLKNRAQRLKEYILAGAGSTNEINQAIANYQVFIGSIRELESGSNFGVPALGNILANSDAQKEAQKRLDAAKLGANKAGLNKNSIGIAQAELDAANKELAEAVPESEEYYKALERQQAAENALADQFSALATAKANVAKSLNIGNPLAIANINISEALRKINESRAAGDDVGVQNGIAELNQAQEERRQYYITLAEARADYDLALVENDPIAAASAAIASAQRAYANARNDADRLKAKAAEVRANRQLANAQQDIANAQIELMQAWADYSGDTVLSAELALQKAKENLAFLKRSGAGEAEVKRAQAGVVQAQAQLRDSQLQDKLDTYNFLYEMDKISKGQLIQYLKSLLEIPNLTEQQVRDIQLQIKQLTDDLGDGFNVPSELNLPTLYEVTRLDQLNGGTYQSARSGPGSTVPVVNNNQQYNITINADGVSTKQALTVVKEAIQSPPRTGSDLRLY